MRKSDKKIDNQIRLALTDICENTLKSLEGFCFVTHTANFNDFPKSLSITCVFEDQQSLSQFLNSNQQVEINKQITHAVQNVGINFKLVKQLITYSTEKR